MNTAIAPRIYAPVVAAASCNAPSHVADAVESLMDGLFRVASSSWAGGNTADRVQVSEVPRAGGQTYRVWSKNGKWSGLDLTRTVTVMPGWTIEVQDAGMDVLDGLITTHLYSPVPATGDIEVYRAAWVRQGRGYDLVAERGYLALHRPTGTAYHQVVVWDAPVGPAKAAQGLARKLRIQGVPQAERDAAKAARTQMKAERQARQLGRLVERMAKLDLVEIADVRITRADSLRAGNCEPGTDAFIDRFFDGRTEGTVGEIGTRATQIGIRDLASLKDTDLTLARQIGAAILQAVRRDKTARRALGV